MKAVSLLLVALLFCSMLHQGLGRKSPKNKLLKKVMKGDCCKPLCIALGVETGGTAMPVCLATCESETAQNQVVDMCPAVCHKLTDEGGTGNFAFDHLPIVEHYKHLRVFADAVSDTLGWGDSCTNACHAAATACGFGDDGEEGRQEVKNYFTSWFGK